MTPASLPPFSRISAVLATAMFLCSSALTQAAIPTTPAKEPDHPPSISLWPSGAPGYESRKNEAEKVEWREEAENNIVFPVTYNIHNPSITPYIPAKEIATGAAVIIAPGGGHMFLTMDREGYDLGKWLADHGVAAFVLKYRLARDKAGNSPYKVEVEALDDARRAMRVVKSRAAEWNIDPARTGVMGFSAGGQVAGLLASRFDNGNPSATDPIEKQSSRPAFQGLIYGYPPASTVFNDQTPPAFLLVAYNDSANAMTMANLFIKLKTAKVPAEIHIYSTGGHGFGVRSDRALSVESWPGQFRGWLNDIGMLGKSTTH